MGKHFILADDGIEVVSIKMENKTGRPVEEKFVWEDGTQVA